MTFQEFAYWQEGLRQRDEMEWTKLGTFMSLFANANRDPKRSKTFEVSDFNPYSHLRKKDAPELTEKDYDVLNKWATKKKVDG